MAGFDDLPNEIILDTLPLVLPEDLENFAQTSKRVFLLAKPFLEHHRQLIRLHSTFESKQVWRHRSGSTPPILSLLIRLRDEPHIGQYIRDVNLKHSGPIQSNMMNMDWDFYREQHDLVNAVVAQSNVPSIQSFYEPKERLCLKSKESYEEFLIALFLLLLPNLSKLTLPWNPARDYLGDMIGQSALEENSWLANLTKVRVQGDFVPKALGIRDLSLFSSLPALKSLMASNARDHGVNIDHYLPTPDSHTKKLELHSSYFARLPLYWYLQSFQSLQKFSLAFYDYNDPLIKRQFDPKIVRAALVAHTKTTLQSLTIKASPNPDAFMGSLQQFEALREVRTQWTILFPKGSCLETWPSRVLPASIRKLQLDDNSGYDNMKEYRALCQGFQCAKEKTCLHLDLVEIRKYWRDWDEALINDYSDDLDGFCREIGMSVTCKDIIPTSAWQRGSNVMAFTFTKKA